MEIQFNIEAKGRQKRSDGFAADSLGYVGQKFNADRLFQADHEVEILDRLSGGPLGEVIDGGEDEDSLRPFVEETGDVAEGGGPHVPRVGKDPFRLDSDERLFLIKILKEADKIDGLQ